MKQSNDQGIKLPVLCNKECNNCPVISHENNRMVTNILNKLHNKFGNEVYLIVQSLCPNLTCCFDCKIDDFCHVEECKLEK